jgi:hypothetical protein
MPSTIDILEPFNRIHPGAFISRYSDWILFTLLLFFFWAVAGISLKKRFEESRYLRVLVTSVALMLSVGTYYSIYQGWLYLNLQGLGLFGAILLFVVVFFIILGLMRGYGMHLSNALPLGFTLFYISLWAISPNILYTLASIFPPANAILLLLFIVSVFKIIFAFFRHSGKLPFNMGKDLQRSKFYTTDDKEIEQQINENKKEKKLLEKKTIRITDLEIKTIDNIENHLEKLVKIIKEKGNSLTQDDVSELSYVLTQIGKNVKVLKDGTNFIKSHINSYETHHRKDISELEKRLSKTKDKKKAKAIKNDIVYQKNMLQALAFMDKYESKIIQFSGLFSTLIFKAMQKVKSQYPNDALYYLEQAYQNLLKMKHIYEKQKKLERYLLKVNKNTISELKKEKDPK